MASRRIAAIDPKGVIMNFALTIGVVVPFLFLGGSLARAQDQQNGGDSFINDPDIDQLSDQDVDANKAMIDALRRFAKKGPIFRISPEELSVEVNTDQSLESTIRITNSGDEPGKISGINIVGSIPNLGMDTTCSENLLQGDFCEITVSYVAGESPGSVRTAIIGSVNERDRSSFEIPVSIKIETPPAPEVNPEERFRSADRPAPGPKKPTSRDVVRGYFGVLGSGAGERGFTIVSAPGEEVPEGSVEGVSYDDISVERVVADDRYDRDLVPSTKASLPVSRDRILTSDRVIKAVLETPVSNVMCNKVVAMVESDVYSATSSIPLIRQGSRVVGECREFVDERVGIAWSRIITTDGRSITFLDADADTRDATGLGGVPGRIYMSKFDKFVLPIFSTMIDATAGVIFATFGEDETVSTDSDGNLAQDRSAENEGLRIITQEGRATAQELLKDIQDVREVVVIPKGTRIDIEILEDIYFDDSKEVVRFADMRFDLRRTETGGAERDLPDNLTLVPADREFRGPTVEVGGRRYRVREAEFPGNDNEIRSDASSRRPRGDQSSEQTIDDIRTIEQGN